MRYDYDQFISRKGTTVRIMDLEDYFHSLPDSEKTISESKREYECTCPYCSGDAYKEDKTYHGHPYLKHKLYMEKDFSFAYCYRCNTAYYSNNMDVHYHIPSLMKEYGAPSLGDLSFKMTDKVYNLQFFKDLPEGNIPEEWEDKVYNRNPYAYPLIEELGFKYAPKIEGIRSHVGLIIPSMWKGKVISYQIWQYPDKPKYWNPPMSNKCLYICGKLKSTAILVEGVFDAIACRTLYPDYTPIALLGCTVTLAQDLMLRSLFLDKIYIRMDDSVKSYKVYNRIKNSLEFTDLEVIESDGTDPEEELCKLAGWHKK